MTSVPDPQFISVACRARGCDEVVPVVIEAGRMPLVPGSGSTITFRLDYCLCERHLRERTAPGRRDLLDSLIQIGTGMKRRAGIPATTTVWLLGPTDGPNGIREAILAVAVTDWPDDRQTPWFGSLPATNDSHPSLFAIAAVMAWLPDLPARWEWTWAVMLPGAPLLPAQAHGRELIRRKRDAARFDAVQNLMWAYARDKSGPKGPRSMSDEQFAERAPAKYCEFLDRYEARPSDKEVAEAMFQTYKTFTRARDRYKAAGNPWPPTCDVDLD